MRWLIGEAWELRVTLLDHLPDRVDVRFGHLDLPVPPLTWLPAHDPDVADLAERVREGES